MQEHDVTWSSLMTMDREDLAKVGITEPEDQQKVLQAVQEMELDRVDMDTLKELDNVDSGSEELNSFLISLQQQCRYLTETVQDVTKRFPQRASQMDKAGDPCRLPLPCSHGNGRRWLLTSVTLGTLGALLFCLSKVASGRVQ
ncbi:hypothetical protein CRUP_030370 [Coryphaenoides rupestris]|nr:hypothetical protein CRUP_030370 [Coryphaenoides rupestris]